MLSPSRQRNGLRIARGREPRQPPPPPPPPAIPPAPPLEPRPLAIPPAPQVVPPLPPRCPTRPRRHSSCCSVSLGFQLHRAVCTASVSDIEAIRVNRPSKSCGVTAPSGGRHPALLRYGSFSRHDPSAHAAPENNGHSVHSFIENYLFVFPHSSRSRIALARPVRGVLCLDRHRTAPQ